MWRNRALTLFALLAAVLTAIVWLGTVLAAATLNFNEGITVSEAGSGTIDNTMLQADDPDAPGAVLTYTLVTTPTNGQIKLNGVTLLPSDEFTQADIDSNFLTYEHNDSETLTDDFSFTVATSMTTVPEASFAITITPVFDQVPVVLDQIFSVPENSTTGTAVNTIVASDLDAGDALTYTIVDGNVGSPFAVGSGDGTITVDSEAPLDFETNENLTFTVEVEDMGQLTDTAVITVNVTNVNEPPTISGGPFTISENSAISTFVGTVITSDVDAGDTFTYTITASDPSTAFAIGQSSGDITVSDSGLLDFETTPTLTITVEITDSGTLTDSADIVINLTDANDPPILTPAGPFDLAENSADASNVGPPLVATDDDIAAGDTLTFTITAGNDSGTFAIGESSGQITVANGSLLDFETPPTSYDLTVQVEDNAGATDTETVTINLINANEPPTISGGPFVITENSAVSTYVGTVITSDIDAGDSFTYAIIASDPAAAFAIGSSGDITVSDQGLLDFESTPTFTITTQIEDSGGLTDTADIIINLTDANDPPVLTPAGPFNLAENPANGTSIGTPIVATDDDVGAGDVLTYTISDGNSSGAFAIGSSSGQITVADNGATNFDFEDAPTSYDLTIQVEDNAGATDTETITINLTDVNEPPVTNNNSFTPNENVANGTEIGSVDADDPEDDPLTYTLVSGNTGSAFALNTGTGEITVNDETQLDYETTPTFTLGISVSDGVNTAVSVTVTINLQNRNEPPMVNDTTLNINENSGNGTVVGTATASDPDTDDGGALTFTILSGNTGGAFAIANDGNNNARITVANSTQLDYETTQSYTLNIRASDPDGLENTATVTININNLFDVTPVVNNATFSVAQSSANGVVVGTVAATDPELAYGDALTFSIIGGNTGTVFAINSSSGQITVPDTSKLDAEGMPTFNLTVRVIDRGGEIDTAAITINVTPLPTYAIFLPMLLNNYPPIEPNNNCSQAYGIGSGTDYEFTADDTEDWYVITLANSGNLTVILSSFEPAQGQLIVYTGSCSSLTLLGNNANTTTTQNILNLGNRPAGNYYIRVYSDPVTNTTYNLRVNVN